MPRKQAKSTRFVKKVRYNTALPNQRMQASSRKRVAKLMKNRSVYGVGVCPGTTCECRVREGALARAGAVAAAVEILDIVAIPCLPDLANPCPVERSFSGEILATNTKVVYPTRSNDGDRMDAFLRGLKIITLRRLWLSLPIMSRRAV
jgi:hypothetical protein